MAEKCNNILYIASYAFILYSSNRSRVLVEKSRVLAGAYCGKT